MQIYHKNSKILINDKGDIHLGELKKKQKKYFNNAVIISVICVISFISFAILQYKLNKNIFTALAIAVIFIEAITMTIYEFLAITIDARIMWIEYSDKHSLKSGVLFLILLIVIPLPILYAMSMSLNNEWKSMINSIITGLITLLPALISLLGIHYSNTMQQINKSEELRNINKPYPSIECKHELIIKNNPVTSFYIDMTISNLANNILVPLYLKHNDIKFKLPYKPITFVKPAEYKNLLIDTQHEFSELILEFSIVYKDALENFYESKFEINLNNRNTTTVNLKEATQILNQKK